MQNHGWKLYKINKIILEIKIYLAYYYIYSKKDMVFLVLGLIFIFGLLVLQLYYFGDHHGF